MTTLMQASHQWASRPADQRFLSLHEMAAKMCGLRDRSRAVVESSSQDRAASPDATHRGLYARDRKRTARRCCHGSDAFLVRAALQPGIPGNLPAGYFRDSRLPAPINVDAMNYNLRFTRNVNEVGLLASLGEDSTVGVPTAPFAPSPRMPARCRKPISGSTSSASRATCWRLPDPDPGWLRVGGGFGVGNTRTTTACAAAARQPIRQRRALGFSIQYGVIILRSETFQGDQ